LKDPSQLHHSLTTFSILGPLNTIWRNELGGVIAKSSTLNNNLGPSSVQSTAGGDFLYVGWLNLIKICRMYMKEEDQKYKVEVIKKYV
jgi:hypothetical protein